MYVLLFSDEDFEEKFSNTGDKFMQAILLFDETKVLGFSSDNMYMSNHFQKAAEKRLNPDLSGTFFHLFLLSIVIVPALYKYLNMSAHVYILKRLLFKANTSLFC